MLIDAENVVNDEKQTSFDLMKPSEKVLEKFSILQKLEIDHKCEPFGELDAHEKLEVLQILCDLLLVSKEFKGVIESLEEKIQQMKLAIDHDFDLLAGKLSKTRAELRQNRVRHFKEIQESNLPTMNYLRRLVNQIIQKEARSVADLM